MPDLPPFELVPVLVAGICFGRRWGLVVATIAHSVMHAMPLRVWLRPVSRHERVGEHSAVVCHCV